MPSNYILRQLPGYKPAAQIGIKHPEIQKGDIIRAMTKNQHKAVDDMLARKSQPNLNYLPVVNKNKYCPLNVRKSRWVTDFAKPLPKKAKK